MKTKLECLGMLLPVIADLGDGCYLVGHPNGVGIGTTDSLTALELAAGKEPQEDSLGTWDGGCLPYDVRLAALQKYTAWAWPLVKSQLDFTNWKPTEKREDEEDEE